LVTYFAWENKSLSDKLIELICETLGACTFDSQCRQLFAIIAALQGIDDSHQAYRIESSFRAVLAVIRNVREVELCKKFVFFVEKHVEDNANAKRWVLRYKEAFKEALYAAGASNVEFNITE
jgi:hypothetical protein